MTLINYQKLINIIHCLTNLLQIMICNNNDVFPITNSTYDTRNENYTINVYHKNNGNVNTQT